MIARSYAYARMRALKSLLLTRGDVAPLLAASDATSLQRALHALEISREASFEKLMRIYASAIRNCGHPIFRAMLMRHEIENVKLMWRVVANDGDRESITRLWLPLGKLATVKPITDATSLRDLAERMAKTPYGAIAMQIVRARGDENAFDRRVAQRIVECSPSSARAHKDPLLAIARRGWREAPGEGQQLQWIRRAFIGDPFSLAPAIATILLAEQEVRAVTAIVESRADRYLDPVVNRVLGA
jgi:vacuolar-type H+-ATPase subunit C/Vma6